MLAFLLRRLVLLVPVLVGLTALVFVISHLLRGDPVMLAAGPNATPADVKLLAVEFGYDRPILQQYLIYVGGLLHGDWGRSLQTRRPVLEDLAVFLPATLELVLAAMAAAVAIGVPMGLAAAVWRGRWPDHLVQGISLAGISVPRFFVGLLLQLGVAVWLDWLPLGGRFPLTDMPPPTVTGFLTVDSVLAGDPGALGAALAALALPALTTCLPPLAAICRMMRASAIEVLQQDFVLTQRALGLPMSLIVCKYVLKNAFSGTLTVIGLYFGWMLGGTVLVETVFDWPGIGLYATKAVLTQDFVPIMGVTLTIGILFVLANLVVDLLYGVLNPKVRIG